MTDYRCGVLIDGLAFPEAPRWRDGRLWFTDQHAHSICSVDADGDLTRIAATTDRPGGLGWLPDGTLLVVYMTERRVMRLDGEALVEYADLSGHASFHCNDLLVDGKGRAYAGNFGYDLHGGAPVATAELILIDTEGGIEIVDRDVVFPNGCVLFPDERTLVCAETFAHRLTAFRLDGDGRVESRALWADLGKSTPDGICLDASDAVWVASPGTGEVVRVQQGGAAVDRSVTEGTPYACTLGGDDRRTLFVCTAETDDPAAAAKMRTGRIEQARVPVAGAGLP